MHFADGAALAAVLFTTLTQNLRFCSSAEAGIALKFWAKKWASCSYEKNKCKSFCCNFWNAYWNWK